MVSRSYLLDSRPPPSRVQHMLHRRVVPALIDLAGEVEALAEWTSVTVRRQPVEMLAAACGVGFLVSVVFRNGATQAFWNTKLREYRL